MKEKILQQASREYTPRQRFLMLAALAPVFVVLIPSVLICLSKQLDQALRLPQLPGGRQVRALGGLMTVAGWLLAIWSIAVQFRLGRGTPAPVAGRCGDRVIRWRSAVDLHQESRGKRNAGTLRPGLRGLSRAYAVPAAASAPLR